MLFAFFSGSAGAQRIGELADGKGQGCAQRPGEGSHAD